MKLVVSRAALLVALSRAAKVSPTNPSSEILAFAKIEAVDGELFVSATDLSTRIVAQVTGEMKIAEEGACLLPAAALSQALRASSADFVGVNTQPGSEVLVLIGVTTYRWKSRPADHFPDILTLNTEAESHVLDCASFLHALTSVRPAMPRENADPRFDQIGIRHGMLQAADGNRYHQVACSDAALVDAALPSAFVADVVELLRSGGETKLTLGLSEDKRAMSVRVGAAILMTRAKAEPWPEIDPIFTNARMSNHDSVQVGRDDLLAAVRRVRMMADPESGAVYLRLDHDTDPVTLVVSARLQTGSLARESLSVRHAGDPRTLVLHHEHLVGLLSMFDSGSVVDLMLGPDSRSKPGSVYLADDSRIGVLQQLRMGWHDGAL